MRGSHARGAGQPHERGADGLRDPLVQLVGNDAADVIRLEDLRVLPHFGFLLPFVAGGTVRPRHAEGRRDARTTSLPVPRRRPEVASPGGLPRHTGGRMGPAHRSSGDERTTRRWPRRPTSIPWPTGSAPDDGRTASLTALASASRSSASRAAGSAGSTGRRTTSQPLGAVSLPA